MEAAAGLRAWFICTEAREILRTSEALVAPDPVIAEVRNIAWKKRRLGQMTLDQAAALAEETAGFFDALVAMATLAPRALAIAESLAHPVYDCFYLALAEEAGARRL